MGNVVSFEDYAKSSKKEATKSASAPMNTGDVMEWVDGDLHNLATKLGMSKEEAYAVAQGFFDSYPALVSYVSEPSFRKEHPISYND